VSGAARSEQEKVVLTYRIIALVLFALLPFSALWKAVPVATTSRTVCSMRYSSFR
jgi:hypothetical protein